MEIIKKIKGIIDKKEKKGTSGRKSKRSKRQQIVERNKKIITIAAIAAAALAVIIILVAAVGSIKRAKSDKKTENGVVVVENDLSELKHLSFDSLSIIERDGRVSVDQFNDILKDLYNKGYCLIDLDQIAYVDADGSFSYQETIMFPEGKKPLIISQSDISYPANAKELGIAEKMVVKDGTIQCSYSNASGTVETGNYDIVPVVENFIKTHPDFSYNGARGILGVSGENGILGYRDTEKQNANEVIAALKEAGWHLASYGFGSNISYGSEFSIMSDDVQKWEQEVKPVVGETNIIILPKQTDIGSWSAYQETNRKYALLKEKGFKYFLVGMNTTPDLLQIRGDYVRETYFKVTTTADYGQIVFVTPTPVPEEVTGQEAAPAEENQEAAPAEENQEAAPAAENQEAVPAEENQEAAPQTEETQAENAQEEA